MSAEENDKPSPPVENQLRRSGRKRKQRKDLDTDYDYDYTNNMPLEPKVFAIYPSGNRPSAKKFPPKLVNTPIETEEKEPVTVTKPVIYNIERNKGIQWSAMEPPDIIDAHVEVLKRRMDFVTRIRGQNIDPIGSTPKPKLSNFLGTDASKYDVDESDEDAIKSVVEKIVKVVSNLATTNQ